MSCTGARTVSSSAFLNRHIRHANFLASTCSAAKHDKTLFVQRERMPFWSQAQTPTVRSSLHILFGLGYAFHCLLCAQFLSVSLSFYFTSCTAFQSPPSFHVPLRVSVCHLVAMYLAPVFSWLSSPCTFSFSETTFSAVLGYSLFLFVTVFLTLAPSFCSNTPPTRNRWHLELKWHDLVHIRV